MTGQELRTFRKERKLTQADVAQELNHHFGTNYNKVVICYIENDLADLPKSMERYLQERYGCKPQNVQLNSPKDDDRAIMPSAEKKSLKSEIPTNWYAKGLKQTERILGWLSENESITTKEAFDYLGIARLASRIHDLKEQGYQFNTEWESSPNRFGKKASYTRYSLKEVEDGKENVDRFGSVE